jgi:hypothetical protein
MPGYFNKKEHISHCASSGSSWTESFHGNDRQRWNSYMANFFFWIRGGGPSRKCCRPATVTKELPMTWNHVTWFLLLRIHILCSLHSTTLTGYELLQRKYTRHSLKRSLNLNTKMIYSGYPTKILAVFIPLSLNSTAIWHWIWLHFLC